MPRALLCALLLSFAATSHASPPAGGPSSPASAPQNENSPKGHATVLRPTTLFLQADTGSDKLTQVTPGRELTILERSSHWLRVETDTDEEQVRKEDQPVFSNNPTEHPYSGWIEDTNAVTSDIPEGDAVLFGEAISFEQAAAAPHPPADAAQSARRLYRMDAELFPNSPRAPEAAWRSADIRWQLQKEDAATLPSAHEKENYLRQLPDESEMKRIEKQYPGSKWASYAAYELIDNKLCGDWQGSEQCPEKEATYYTKFADQYPDSPKAPQALYEAAWRLANAGDMWTSDNNDHRATDDRNASVNTAEHLLSKYPNTDYAARAAALIFKINHHIPIYGSDRE